MAAMGPRTGMCCSKRNGGVTKVTLLFHRCELLNDLKQYAFVEGDVMKVQEEHERHQTMDIVEDGNVERVTRVLNIAWARSVEALYPYCKEPADGLDVLDNMLESPQDYVTDLRLPDGVAASSVVLAKELIHEYMVCTAMAEWMSITNVEAEGRWRQKAETAIEGFRSALNNRRRPLRRKQHPFG